MPKQSVIGIVEHQGLVALVRNQADDPGKLAGKLHLPGGGIEPEESTYTAAVREIYEETGLEVIPKKFLSFQVTEKGTHVKWYSCQLTREQQNTPQLKAGVEEAEALWAAREEVTKTCAQAAKYWPQPVKEYLNR